MPKYEQKAYISVKCATPARWRYNIKSLNRTVVAWSIGGNILTFATPQRGSDCIPRATKRITSPTG